MHARNPAHVPIYHPVLKKVSHVAPQTVATWQRSGWVPGDGPAASSGSPERRPRAAVERTKSPDAPAPGPDVADLAPSSSSVKES